MFLKEITLKKALFDEAGKYYESVTAGLLTRIDAQNELLDLILHNLKNYHSNYFEVTKEFVKVQLTGDTFW